VSGQFHTPAALPPRCIKWQKCVWKFCELQNGAHSSTLSALIIFNRISQCDSPILGDLNSFLRTFLFTFHRIRGIQKIFFDACALFVLRSYRVRIRAEPPLILAAVLLLSSDPLFTMAVDCSRSPVHNRHNKFRDCSDLLYCSVSQWPTCFGGKSYSWLQYLLQDKNET